MTPDTILVQLYRIADSQEFAYRSGQLVEDWIGAGAGFEAVAPILQFMEEHPVIDYGRPGALVHFMERFRDRGYAELLMLSLQRRPTQQTVWMLERLAGEQAVAQVGAGRGGWRRRPAEAGRGAR